MSTCMRCALAVCAHDGACLSCYHSPSARTVGVFASTFARLGAPSSAFLTSLCLLGVALGAPSLAALMIVACFGAY